MTKYSDYDYFASYYNKNWGTFNVPLMKSVRDLLLKNIPEKGNILDLCCGTGQFANRLSSKGYNVTGIDISRKMIEIAENSGSGVKFILGDITEYSSRETYDAITSIFDSLNHILKEEDLEKIYKNAFNSLKEGGILLFDMLMEEGFQEYWNGKNTKVTDQHVFIDNSFYDNKTKLGTHIFTIFQYHEHWQRIDGKVTERAYDLDKVVDLLRAAGFKQNHVYHFEKDLNLVNRKGRYLFVCKK
ncbi:class I SAM-dependent DNA methyltransferase [Alkalihalophilus marmarensis]|uniref:class I SAM-dependent DNA methyltransferase n=1 Tax=Alkalihalophilus marmarensis TaxID=521377 RepID=UPI002DBAF138|nr:class I SAM-dependent methyltransferase [Alkalihalophilus marmarensis]MEC2074258.1 class I SAM-dependent methyltransferase [Alkalihalophilus marmarensis]